MPTPNDNEDRDQFLSRCMEDPEARRDFPENDQRYAFCNSQWQRNKGTAMYEQLHVAMLAETWAIGYGYLELMMRAAAKGEIRRQGKLPRVNGQVAILPLHGMMSQRASIWHEMFGGTSTEGFGAAFSRAMMHDRVKAVVIDVDSPGGTTGGVEALSDLIFSGRSFKPTVSVANSLAASAAYWAASSAKHMVAAPGADVGSIGVFRIHEDISGHLEQQGVKITQIGLPEYKTEGSPYGPLTEEAIDHHRNQVSATYEAFNGAAARNRDVTASQARERFGKGRTVHAAQAVEMNLVDRVRTLPQVLRELGVGTGKAVLSKAEEDDITQELSATWMTGEPEPLPKPKTVKRRKMELLTKLISK